MPELIEPVTFDPSTGLDGKYVMIKSLRVENFRCFKVLGLLQLKRVNIVVGDNSSGKTALLESIKLGTDGVPQLFPWLSQMRNLPIVLPANPTQQQFESLFVDFFHDFEAQKTISVSLEDNSGNAATLRVYFDPKRAVTAQPTIGFQPAGAAASLPPSTIVPLAFERDDFQGRKTTVCATINQAGQLFLEPGQAMGPTSSFFSNAYFGNPAENAGWLSSLSIDKRSDEVIEALRRHFPYIGSVTSETLGPGLGTVYVDLPHLPRKLPLSEASGGISRLFTLMLAVLQYRRGIVLIDEIENGIFHQQYPLIWKTLYDLAGHHETQLFISTHSSECLRAAIPTVSEAPEDFALLKVRRSGSTSDVDIYRGDQLRAALEKNGDVRE